MIDDGRNETIRVNNEICGHVHVSQLAQVLWCSLRWKDLKECSIWNTAYMQRPGRKKYLHAVIAI